MGIQQQIDGVLAEFGPLYQNFYKWLAGQYDSNYGGFYYAVSSKSTPEFQPDIESTAQAIHILDNSNLITAMPELMRQQLIDFFQKRQTSEGYFFDFQNDMRQVERMVGRAIMYSASSLRLLGSEPKIPLPGSKENGDTLPDYLKSLTTLKRWLDERPWDYAWMAGDNIQASGVYYRAMSEVKRQEYLDFIWQYLEARQDRQTGLWGEGRPYIRISGAFKLALFYRSFGKVMPRGEQIYQSILTTLREDVSEDMCWTRNPMDLLLALQPQLGSYPVEDILEILKITHKNLQRYLKPDGGFSRHVEHSLETPNNVPLGKGLVEGDMNASTQGLRIRLLAYYLANRQEKIVALPCRKDFYEQVVLEV